MKAIILCAGLGTRLGNIGEEIPKCLTKIGDETLLENKINILTKIGIEKKDIIVVIGNEGKCWKKENQDIIKKIIENIIINYENTKTNNSYSLKLALGIIDYKDIKKDDYIVLDGDLVIPDYLIKEIIDKKENLILTRTSNNFDDPGNRVLLDKTGKVMNLSRNVNEFSLPYLIYGGVIRIKKENINDFIDYLKKEVYKRQDLGVVINDITKIIPIYNLTNENWININTKEDLEKAKKISNKNFTVLMTGYTGVGKSTIAKRIATLPNTDIFHSAVIRKELDLNPKNPEDADKFFDYRNNLRQDVDKVVYNRLAKNAEKSIKNGKNVIIDAGHFFKWQRKDVYDKVIPLGSEIFVIKIICPDEDEIKRRFEERKEKFNDSPFNETPSWNSYISTKILTEPIEDDIITDKYNIKIIEYDTHMNSLNLISGNESENSKKIMKAIKTEGTIYIQDDNYDINEIQENKIKDLIKNKFVIALDFDGVVTYPHKLKTEHINHALEKSGYNIKIKEEQSSRRSCLSLGIPLDIYRKGSVAGETTEQKYLSLSKNFIDNFKKIRDLKNISLFIVSSRFDSMVRHLKEYLRYHKLRFDGIIHTREVNKIFSLKKINAKIIIDDNPFDLSDIIKEDENFLDKCDLILYRDVHNKHVEKPHEKIIEIDNWNDLYKYILKKYKKFIEKK